MNVARCLPDSWSSCWQSESGAMWREGHRSCDYEITSPSWLGESSFDETTDDDWNWQMSTCQHRFRRHVGYRWSVAALNCRPKCQQRIMKNNHWTFTDDSVNAMLTCAMPLVTTLPFAQLLLHAAAIASSPSIINDYRRTTYLAADHRS